MPPDGIERGPAQDVGTRNNPQSKVAIRPSPPAEHILWLDFFILITQENRYRSRQTGRAVGIVVVRRRVVRLDCWRHDLNQAGNTRSAPIWKCVLQCTIQENIKCFSIRSS